MSRFDVIENDDNECARHAVQENKRVHVFIKCNIQINVSRRLSINVFITINGYV